MRTCPWPRQHPLNHELGGGDLDVRRRVFSSTCAALGNVAIEDLAWRPVISRVLAQTPCEYGFSLYVLSARRRAIRTLWARPPVRGRRLIISNSNTVGS